MQRVKSGDGFNRITIFGKPGGWRVVWLALFPAMTIWISGCAHEAPLPCPRIPDPEIGMEIELDTIRACCPSTYLWMRRVVQAERAGG
jgi:hypothetical protein